ncbi:MAG: hypothetical protein DDT34_00991 [Firmicutes bacterium]|nr:hypothetical protein [Bacillota bacterium]
MFSQRLQLFLGKVLVGRDEFTGYWIKPSDTFTAATSLLLFFVPTSRGLIHVNDAGSLILLMNDIHINRLLTPL